MSDSPTQPISILVVDDDAIDRMALHRSLRGTSLNTVVQEATNVEEALKTVFDSRYDCIFVDYHLPGQDGLAFVRKVRQEGIDTPLVVLTGQGSEQTAVELMKAGASDYLPKNKLSPETLTRIVLSALRMYQAEILVKQTNQRISEKNRQLERINRELERKQQQIYRQNLQLQEVSRLKSEFLATMSHELRTPLNAIIGFSQILLGGKKGDINETQRDMLGRVLSNGRHLLELISDILELSKIEAGRLELEPCKMDLVKLVEETVEELQSLITPKQLDLKVDITLNDPIITNDPTRVRQVLINLLSNAIKFTQHGSITVSIKSLTTKHSCMNGGSEEILLSVSDTGCGISDVDQPYIFEAFHQSDQRTNRHHAGTGLGLAITYSLVKMMCGDITVESQVDKGSTFRVRIPHEVCVETASANALNTLSR
ncbi:ATPase, histidine kinase-, DNA gyrase B-, and HSP90-like domain protein [Synechococcus sp. PCC 7335]|uniref:ATP-binding response regulator n=1 Tax=Synechococcus sp. (strain ATCC 29403 / PCC 7335) TaxID=91464 RepID=UPI00017EBF9F|nr:hybrid sensor histidine kinase/response regulator [Synechococcus sp. PCC 7335]EDX86254.1 ATPase, histidine kinase-, DNA gyrase B-, and HSP90-like domain protein [Synechococcus sp. PCC 7335]